MLGTPETVGNTRNTGTPETVGTPGTSGTVGTPGTLIECVIIAELASFRTIHSKYQPKCVT